MKNLIVEILLPAAIVVAIAVLIVFIAWQCAPDKIIYQFAYDDEVVTFEGSCERQTSHYYVFRLDDGTTVTYYPKPGAVVSRTEIRN